MQIHANEICGNKNELGYTNFDLCDRKALGPCLTPGARHGVGPAVRSHEGPAAGSRGKVARPSVELGRQRRKPSARSRKNVKAAL